MENEEIYVPSYDDISNPDSFFYDPYWYEICEIPNDDPWQPIVQDFIDGRNLIIVLKKNGLIKNHQIITNKLFESSKSADVTDLAGGELEIWANHVEEHLSTKNINPEFLRSWGEFQKNYARIKLAYPTLIKKRHAGKKAQKINKDPQRQWYVLWLYNDPDKSRSQVNKDLTDLGIKIMKGEVVPPSGWTERELRDFVVDLSGEGSEFHLASTFLEGHFYKKSDLEKFHKLAKANQNLPPVGMEYYKTL